MSLEMSMQEIGHHSMHFCWIFDAIPLLIHRWVALKIRSRQTCEENEKHQNFILKIKHKQEKSIERKPLNLLIQIRSFESLIMSFCFCRRSETTMRMLKIAFPFIKIDCQESDASKKISFIAFSTPIRWENKFHFFHILINVHAMAFSLEEV